jgi:hypothetical protein
VKPFVLDFQPDVYNLDGKFIYIQQKIIVIFFYQNQFMMQNDLIKKYLIDKNAIFFFLNKRFQPFLNGKITIFSLLYKGKVKLKMYIISFKQRQQLLMRMKKKQKFPFACC